MEDEGTMFEARINPLAFIKADNPGLRSSEGSVDLQDILEMLCTPGLARDPVSLVGRWKEISLERNRLFVVPNEQKFLDRIVWPLRHAKSGYMVGDYLGTISLCGTVAEMPAILLFDISVSLRSKPVSDTKEGTLDGNEFERLGQDRRVKVLRRLGIIDEPVKTLFDEIRRVRKKYLHLYSQSHENLANDAAAVFGKTVDVIVQGLALSPREGRVTMRPDFVAYLKKLGIATDTEPPSTTD